MKHANDIYSPEGMVLTNKRDPYFLVLPMHRVARSEPSRYSDSEDSDGHTSDDLSMARFGGKTHSRISKSTGHSGHRKAYEKVCIANRTTSTD